MYEFMDIMESKHNYTYIGNVKSKVFDGDKAISTFVRNSEAKLLCIALQGICKKLRIETY